MVVMEVQSGSPEQELSADNLLPKHLFMFLMPAQSSFSEVLVVIKEKRS